MWIRTLSSLLSSDVRDGHVDEQGASPTLTRGASGCYLRARLGGALLIALVILALGAASASAETTHLFEASFGPDGTAATTFERAGPVGIDQSTGNIYVADASTGAGAGSVQKFNSAHEPEPFTGFTAVGGRLTGFHFFVGQPVNEIAVNSASHDLYVASAFETGVKGYQSDGEPALFTAGPDKGTNEILGSEPCGVAVDGNGAIYVSFADGVHVYAPSGESLTIILKSTLSGFPCNLAVSSPGIVDEHGAVYAALFNGGVEKLVPSEFPVTTATEYTSAGIVDANPSVGVAADPTTDHLYVEEHTQVAEYDEAGTLLDIFGASGAGALTAPEGIAVNGVTGDTYVSDLGKQVEVFGPTVLLPTVTTGVASEIGPHTATLNGIVNPEGVAVTDCHFDFGTTTSYGQTAPCKPVVGSGSGEVVVTAKLTGLQVGTEYHFRLVAANAIGSNLGQDRAFSTFPAPAITAAAATNLTAETADLGAKVNPGGLPIESCQFEYGTEARVYLYQLGCTPAAAQIGSGTAPVPVSTHLKELEHDTVYHWRIVATSEAGTTASADHSFVYATTGRGPLPDGRAYEMVTPTQKNGALVGTVFLGLQPDMAGSGSRLVLSTLQCFLEGSCPANRRTVGTPYAFTRTPAGWQPSSLAPPASEFPSNTAWIVNADEGTGLFSMETSAPGEDQFYTRDVSSGFGRIGPVTSPVFGARGATGSGFTSHATADFSHVVYEEGLGGVGLHWPFDETLGGNESVYEYTGPGSQPALLGVHGGSFDLISRCGTELGSRDTGREDEAMSADGRLVYFTAHQCKEGGSGVNAEVEVPANELWVHVEGSDSVQVSARSGPSACSGECATSSPRDSEFEGASADGTKAFFTDTQQLTNGGSQDATSSDSAQRCSETSGANGCNLYLYDFGRPAGERLVALSAGDSSGDGPRVQGVLAVPKSGARVYFVAKGVLSPTANARGETAQDGSENLYVWGPDETHPNGVVKFVTALSSTTSGFKDSDQWFEGAKTANVTEDGRFLVFTSHRPLTVDDSRADGGPAQVFRYDAVTGQLVRISVGAGGFNDNGNAGVGDATIVPTAAFQPFAGNPTRNPTMSDDGSAVFFMSPIGLTPQALRGVLLGTGELGNPEYAQNIYEYREGHVSLISDGRDVGVEPVAACSRGIEKLSDVCLVGVSGSGHDVFFTSSDQLVPQDTDTQLDYYDARVCEPEHGNPCVSPASPPLPPCTGEACHGIPAPTPGAPSGGTATFNGAGNIVPPPTGGPTKPACSSSSGSPSKACTRKQNLTKALAACKRRFAHKRKKRQACEHSARHRYGAKKTSRSTRSR
jgi:hypothetical protein